jgi:hypothetical protein
VIALDRQGWILAGFVVLFATAIAVSACGWVLLWRTRRRPRAEPVAVVGPNDEKPEGPLAEEPEGPPAEEAAPVLPPGNPLR